MLFASVVLEKYLPKVNPTLPAPINPVFNRSPLFSKGDVVPFPRRARLVSVRGPSRYSFLGGIPSITRGSINRKIVFVNEKEKVYNSKVRNAGSLRGVAQFGSAPDWGSGGRRFKSCLSDHR